MAPITTRSGREKEGDDDVVRKAELLIIAASDDAANASVDAVKASVDAAKASDDAAKASGTATKSLRAFALETAQSLKVAETTISKLKEDLETAGRRATAAEAKVKTGKAKEKAAKDRAAAAETKEKAATDRAAAEKEKRQASERRTTAARANEKTARDRATAAVVAKGAAEDSARAAEVGKDDAEERAANAVAESKKYRERLNESNRLQHLALSATVTTTPYRDPNSDLPELELGAESQQDEEGEGEGEGQGKGEGEGHDQGEDPENPPTVLEGRPEFAVVGNIFGSGGTPLSEERAIHTLREINRIVFGPWGEQIGLDGRKHRSRKSGAIFLSFCAAAKVSNVDALVGDKFEPTADVVESAGQIYASVFGSDSRFNQGRDAGVTWPSSLIENKRRWGKKFSMGRQILDGNERKQFAYEFWAYSAWLVVLGQMVSLHA